MKVITRARYYTDMEKPGQKALTAVQDDKHKFKVSSAIDHSVILSRRFDTELQLTTVILFITQSSITTRRSY